ELFAKLRYAERAQRGVLVLETRATPTDEVAAWVGQKAGLAPSQLTLVVAPTASLAGGVQIAARILETGLHKMDTLGFDVTKVVSGIGTAPLPPVAKNDLRAIGRTNDCILYGGQARYTVNADDAELAELAAQVPASASKDYGTPFYDIFKRYDGDFYKIDPLLFSPAEVWLTSVGSGKTYHAGHVNPDVLRASLLEACTSIRSSTCRVRRRTSPCSPLSTPAALPCCSGGSPTDGGARRDSRRTAGLAHRAALPRPGRARARRAGAPVRGPGGAPGRRGVRGGGRRRGHRRVWRGAGTHHPRPLA